MQARLPNRWAALFLLAPIGTTPLSAQEFNPVDPVILTPAVCRADLIFTGTFRVTWPYPWFDGWRYRATLRVETVLGGTPPPEAAIEFHWTESYGATCLLCERRGQLNGQRGIWLLTRKDGTWNLTEIGALWCSGPPPMRAQAAVEQGVRAKPKRRIAR